MRIAILNLTAGGMSGGYRKYLKSLLPRLSLASGVESILCASPKSLCVDEWFERLENVQFANCLPYRPSRPHDFELSRGLRRFSPDVIFVPMERNLAVSDVPLVNMVQNMLPMIPIENNIGIERLRNLVQKFLARRAVTRASRVIAVSKFVKEFLRSNWSVPAEHIGMVYHGVESNSDVMIRPKSIPAEW